MLLTIFYDGFCPLCTDEMEELRELDKAGNLKFEDIYATHFSENYPEIDIQQADAIIHGMTFDGQMIYGLDVISRAWQLVGKKHWLQVLRWPGIKWISDWAYLIFARYRYKLSHILTGQERCERCIR